MVNGTTTDDGREAAELFPHTRRCIDRMRSSAVQHGKVVPCVCPATARRRIYLKLINRIRLLAYTDAYAKVRHEAKVRAERTLDPGAKAAFEEVASWAESLEVGQLEG